MKIKNVEKNLEASLGRMPTDEEVARVAGVDVKRLELISNFGVSYAMQRATGNRNFADEIGDRRRFWSPTKAMRTELRHRQISARPMRKSVR